MNVQNTLLFPSCVRLLAHEAQLDAFGGYSSAVKRALKDAWEVCKRPQSGCAANSPEKGSAAASRHEEIVSATASFALKPATPLVREWNGRTIRLR